MFCNLIEKVVKRVVLLGEEIIPSGRIFRENFIDFSKLWITMRISDFYLDNASVYHKYMSFRKWCTHFYNEYVQKYTYQDQA